MDKGRRKQFVPIFVGSTFEDLKPYRRAVRDTLAQLETVVRGMEYFGSKPGSPVDECLAVVRTCSVYIGIFGMRYGTIPDGHDLSMTHLEYEEAQGRDIPSLVYIIDEENQPILPKFVETGRGADLLRNFKAELKQNHVMSSFTTPEDLASKISRDVPELLKHLGKEVLRDSGAAQQNTGEIIARFSVLPQRYRGREVVLEYPVDELHPVDAHECDAMRLPPGATLYGGTKAYQ